MRSPTKEICIPRPGAALFPGTMITGRVMYDPEALNLNGVPTHSWDSPGGRHGPAAVGTAQRSARPDWRVEGKVTWRGKGYPSLSPGLSRDPPNAAIFNELINLTNTDRDIWTGLWRSRGASRLLGCDTALR